MEAEGFYRITYKHENPEAVCLGDTLQECYRRVKEKGILVAISSSDEERAKIGPVLVMSCS